jgi:hypothetical protein
MSRPAPDDQLPSQSLKCLSDHALPLHSLSYVHVSHSVRLNDHLTLVTTDISLPPIVPRLITLDNLHGNCLRPPQSGMSQRTAPASHVTQTHPHTLQGYEHKPSTHTCTQEFPQAPRYAHKNFHKHTHSERCTHTSIDTTQPHTQDHISTTHTR